MPTFYKHFYSTKYPIFEIHFIIHVQTSVTLGKCLRTATLGNQLFLSIHRFTVHYSKYKYCIANGKQLPIEKKRKNEEQEEDTSSIVKWLIPTDVSL